MQFRFPKVGTKWEDLRARMSELRRRDVGWREGRTALHVYFAGDDVLNVAREAYGMFMMESSLAPLAFPSLAEMERELVPLLEKMKGYGAGVVHYKICSTFDSSPETGSIGKVLERLCFGRLEPA